MKNNSMDIQIKEIKAVKKDEIIHLYKANNWSSADKPDKLFNALLHSHTLLSAWDGCKLVGIANAISDGYLVVYYPHMLIHPDYQGKGIGTSLMKIMLKKYSEFHQQMLVADGKAIDFYKKCGFEKAGKTESMWIYQGDEH